MRKLCSLAFITLAVCAIASSAAAQGVPGLINYQGRLADGSGAPVTGTVPMTFTLWDKALTQDPVTNETITLTGTTPAALVHQGLVSGSVVVTAVGGVPAYESPRDYTVDLATGTVTRSVGGFILSGQQVEVDYVWNNGGNQVWTEAQAITVNGGLYNVMLGELNPMSAVYFANPDLFLEVTINGEILASRTRLTSVAYAMSAGLLGGQPASYYSPANHSHAFSAITGSVTDAQVPDNITVLFASGAAYADDAGTLEGYYADDFALAGHSHAFSAITGSVTDAQVPDNITVSYAANSGQLAGLPASSYASATHSHNFTAITGTVSDMQVPDNITVTLANNSSMLGGLLPSAYVLVAGDTVTGALQVNGALQARNGLSVLAGGIGIGQAPAANYGITNATAAVYPAYGARFHGSTEAILGVNSTYPNNWGILGSTSFGVRGNAGTTASGTAQYGGLFNATSQQIAYGVQATATGSGSADVYGGHFIANPDGSGYRYGVYAQATANDNSDIAVGVRGTTKNTSTTADTYAGFFDAQDSAGENVGVYGRAWDYAAYFANTNDMTNRWVAVGQPQKAVQVNYVNSSALALVGYEATLTGTSALAGASITVTNNSTSTTAYGVKSFVTMAAASDAPGYAGYFNASGGDSGLRAGVYGYATAGDTTAGAYGVYGYAANLNGPAYGVYGSAGYSNDYAGYFGTGKVRVGTAGTENFVNGSGDLYVADANEAGEFYYHGTQERHYAVSLVNSPTELTSPSDMWRMGSSSVICSPTETCAGWFVVNLPDRATVTEFRLWGQTAEADHYFYCELKTISLTGGTWWNMAFVSSATTAMTLSDNTITTGSIDNTNYSYMILCTETDNTRANTVYIYGMRITYTVDGPE